MSLKGKILVVDDEETTRFSLADILKLEGCKVRTAADGVAALDLLQKETFDLMLLDLKMPGMDGIEVMRAAVKISPEMQVILLTAHGSLESAIEALRHGAFDYLLKPSSPSQIIRSVGRGLERQAEARRKRNLIEQLETSLHQLKSSETSSGELAVENPDDPVIPLGDDIYVDVERREIWRGDQRAILTPAEGKLLRVLLENRNRVFTHRELVQRVQGYETTDWEAPEVLRPLVSRLRRKLAGFPGGDQWISNVRGTGYVFQGRR